MDAPSAAQFIASGVAFVGVATAAYTSRRGSKDTVENQQVAHKLEEDRDAFARMRELLTAEQGLVNREGKRADRADGRAEDERKSGEEWRRLFLAERVIADQLRADLRDMALAMRDKVVKAGAADGVEAGDIPPLDEP